MSELSAAFDKLRADVESLLLQAPGVDLDALAAQVVEMGRVEEEQAALVAVSGAGVRFTVRL